MQILGCAKMQGIKKDNRQRSSNKAGISHEKVYKKQINEKLSSRATKKIAFWEIKMIKVFLTLFLTLFLTYSKTSEAELSFWDLTQPTTLLFELILNKEVNNCFPKL
jgi:L-lactate permease